jgi:Fe2+ transport system protein FeoA
MLTQLKTGEIARIVAINGGQMLRQNLLLRGVDQGSIIRVISNMGPVTIEVDRNTVALGRGMAQKIQVLRV